VLAWIVGRLEGDAGGTDTPIGVVPSVEDLDLSGLDESPERVAQALVVDPEQWKAEAANARGHFAEFGDHLPSALVEELDALESRLR